jgi:hypothetical protein
MGLDEIDTSVQRFTLSPLVEVFTVPLLSEMHFETHLE